jgi:glucose/arabinose dehydrogenase
MRGPARVAWPHMTTHLRSTLAVAVATLCVLGAGDTVPAGAAVTLQQIGTFDFPVFVTAPPTDYGRVFVVERAGRIQVVHDGVTSTFLDLTSMVKSGGEQGLLSMAFAPDYATSGTFYVYYTEAPAGGGESNLVIAAFQRSDADHGDPGSERVLLRIPHTLAPNHNGGQLQIGPDGLLWVGTGDGGANGDHYRNAQRLDPGTNDDSQEHNALLGKLLRIDPTPGNGCGGACTVPAGNPGFAQPEVWAYGLRNPWRFSFDLQTGDLVVADVGQDLWEEVDFLPAPDRGRGADFGWSALEATHPYSGGAVLQPAGVTPVGPVIERSHGAPDGFVSITGGYVVRDLALPDLEGRYLYGDYGLGDIRAVTLAAGQATGDTPTGLHVDGGLTSFGEDACGRVYALSGDGPVYRLAQSGDCIPPPAATGGAPGGSGPAATANSAAPTPKVRVAARQRVWPSSGVTLTVSCDLACYVRGEATLQVTRARGRATAAAVRPLHTAAVTARLAAKGSARLALRLGPATRRSVVRALHRHRVVTARISVTATGSAGRHRTTVAHVVLALPRRG